MRLREKLRPVTSLPEQLLSQAIAWADADPDPHTQREMRELISQSARAELEDRLGASLEFGTAGLRGLVGAGPNRMNLAVVRRTSAGLARYLKKAAPEAVSRGVVIGRDSRHGSVEFLTATAQVMAAEGIAVYVLSEPSPTPLTAFALKQLGAAAAVMVTASHNPPEYNGYKVYWGNGAQIVPPHDGGIARAIAQVEPANQVRTLSEEEARARGLWTDVAAAVSDAYLESILALRPRKQSAGLLVVYTAMHGVGGRWAVEALQRAGCAQVWPVPEQQEPDARFPTVRFPNPEEPGAMNLATALAEARGADIVLANDPDADRLAAMARSSAGQLRQLTGNEVGVLLGHYMLTQQRVEKPLVITTIVSSSQLRCMAQALGARCEETLTGFKWIANRALELEAHGYRFVMGYEEALGYTVGDVVRDKDGIGAAVVVADMASWCKARGTTLLGYLEEIQREFGLFVASQFNATLPGLQGAETIREVMRGFRQRQLTEVTGHTVVSARDYAAQPSDLPAAEVLSWELAGGSRITLRPSGTEPKIKVYFEWRETLHSGETMAAAKTRAATALALLESGFLSAAEDRGLPRSGAGR